MKFLLDNVFLIAIALVSGGLLAWPLFRKGGGSATLSALEATQLINHRNAIVVDVRDEKDFALGSLAGARNLPFASVGDRAGELVRFKSRPMLIVCDAGQQSARAVATFKAQGFDEAYSLAGGVAAWKQAGLPLVQGGRSTATQAPRKAKNDARSGDRGKAGKSGRREATASSVAAPVVAPAAASPIDAASLSSPSIASEAPTTPDRVKELS